MRRRVASDRCAEEGRASISLEERDGAVWCYQRSCHRREAHSTQGQG